MRSGGEQATRSSGAPSGAKPPAKRKRKGSANERSAKKQKVSLTLDRDLVDEIRDRFDGEKLSSATNALLHQALAQSHLLELVDEMEREAGPASAEAYERVLAQWFSESSDSSSAR